MGRPIQILLVEDNPGDVRLTREALNEGHVRNTLSVAKDGVGPWPCRGTPRCPAKGLGRTWCCSTSTYPAWTAGRCWPK